MVLDATDAALLLFFFLAGAFRFLAVLRDDVDLGDLAPLLALRCFSSWATGRSSSLSLDGLAHTRASGYTARVSAGIVVWRVTSR